MRFISDVLGSVSVDMLVARLAGLDAEDSDLEALANFPELEYLELNDTKVSEAGIDKLKAALPKCQIVEN